MTTFNVDSLDFVDDEEARFGAGADFSARYSSSNSRLELEDLTAGAVGYIPQDISTDLVGGKFAETVSEGKALSDNGQVYDSIQAAVDNASSWVKVGPGDFRESVTIDTAGLTLEGSGKRTKINNKNSEIALSISALNVTVADINVNSQTQGIDIFDNNTGIIVVQNVEVRAERSACTVSRASGSSIITGCSFVSNARCLSLGYNNIAVNSEFSAIGDAGDAIGGGVWSDNIVAYNNIPEASDKGIDLLSTETNLNNIIYANNIKNTGDEGIDTVGTSQNIIAKNRLINTGGIVDTGTGNIIDSNLITE